jgi:hypothetical protein
MDDRRAVRVSQVLETLGRDLEELEKAGHGIPAVERNVLRMRGALRTLQIQFLDLAALEGEG